MVHALDAGSSGLGSSVVAGVIVGVVFLGWPRLYSYTLIVLFFTQVYKWVMAKLLLGV